MSELIDKGYLKSYHENIAKMIPTQTQYSTLTTQDKTLVGAVNEAKNPDEYWNEVYEKPTGESGITVIWNKILEYWSLFGNYGYGDLLEAKNNENTVQMALGVTDPQDFNDVVSRYVVCSKEEGDNTRVLVTIFEKDVTIGSQLFTASTLYQSYGSAELIGDNVEVVNGNSQIKMGDLENVVVTKSFDEYHSVHEEDHFLANAKVLLSYFMGGFFDYSKPFDWSQFTVTAKGSDGDEDYLETNLLICSYKLAKINYEPLSGSNWATFAWSSLWLTSLADKTVQLGVTSSGNPLKINVTSWGSCEFTYTNQTNGDKYVLSSASEYGAYKWHHFSDLNMYIDTVTDVSQFPSDFRDTETWVMYSTAQANFYEWGTLALAYYTLQFFAKNLVYLPYLYDDTAKRFYYRHKTFSNNGQEMSVPAIVMECDGQSGDSTEYFYLKEDVPSEFNSINGTSLQKNQWYESTESYLSPTYASYFEIIPGLLFAGCDFDMIKSIERGEYANDTVAYRDVEEGFLLRLTNELKKILFSSEYDLNSVSYTEVSPVTIKEKIESLAAEAELWDDNKENDFTFVCDTTD